jgi:hypothetical protein
MNLKKRYMVKPKDGIISPLEIDTIDVIFNSITDPIDFENEKDKLRIEVIKVNSLLIDKEKHNITNLVNFKFLYKVFKNCRNKSQKCC